MYLTGAEIIVEVLIEQGVTELFGYPGGTALQIYEALYHRQDRIHHYITAHEQGAAHAADGYARATGKTGVCLATSGPGATNLVTGIATAYLDSVPMVAITANVGTDMIGKDSFQEVFITGITNPITKHNYAVRDISRLAHTLRTAFRIAQSGRKGPVLIDIPKDLTTASADFTPAPRVEPAGLEAPSAAAIAHAAELIQASRRPVLCFGGGVISSGCSEALRAFSRKAELHVCHTIMGVGVVGFDEELELGMIGMHGSVRANTAIAQADLVIAAGIRFSDRVALKSDQFAPKARILQFDIDPSEIGKNVETHESIIGDLGTCLAALTPLVQKTDRTAWQKTLRELRKQEFYPQEQPGALRPYDIMRVIARETPDDTVIVTDVGQHQIWAAQYCKQTRPRGFITSGGLGTMGFGYGAAIGAKVALPASSVIHITGDASFHMNMIETCTAVSNNLQIITVILDNHALGMVRQLQTFFYDRHYIATAPARKTDFVKLAAAFGAHGFFAGTEQALQSALHEALQINGPSLIVCPVGQDELVLPMIPSGKTVDDMIVDEQEVR